GQEFVSKKNIKTRWVFAGIILIQIVAGFFSFNSDLVLVGLIALFSLFFALFLFRKVDAKKIFGRLDISQVSFKEFFALFAGLMVLSICLRLGLLIASSFGGPKLAGFFLSSPRSADLLCSKNFCSNFIEANLILILPFFEEIFFRGFILTRQIYKFGIVKGLIFASLLFALLHGVDVLAIFPLGFFLGYLYIKY